MDFLFVVQTVVPFLVARFDHQSMEVTLKIPIKFVLLFLECALTDKYLFRLNSETKPRLKNKEMLSQHEYISLSL